jgi:hypothetical protein
MTRIKRSIETIWEEYPKTYPTQMFALCPSPCATHPARLGVWRMY